ncbi:E3 ubiquitin-protein ligase NEURL3-like isoform X1 [Brachyhypopomus gauderio]|uniref:E3 ubiquitin-protein ligase NEURL3-like isoform X1 n=1 Tax=Brachyhypopomus gauderio TaxID=698409 RepID=UPI004043560E
MARLKTKSSTKGTHRACGCGNGCLGPLMFNAEAKGQLVRLSEGSRRATREISSFQHGLVFSSRPVKIQEKACLRIERSVSGWHGALRIGITTVEPGSRTLPPLAIPDLTSSQGYWATLVPEDKCEPRTELKFWVCRRGYLRIRTSDGQTHIMETQVNTRDPIWAMIDVYGQTNTILLIGSEKKGFFSTRRSCPVLTIDATEENCGYDILPTEKPQKIPEKQTPASLFSQNNEHSMECVVCFSTRVDVLLVCGHRCLCPQCASRVAQEIGSCPLCRHRIRPADILLCTLGRPL